MINKPWQKQALSLHEEGYSNRAIGRKLDKDESVIRRYLKRVNDEKFNGCGGYGTTMLASTR